MTEGPFILSEQNKNETERPQSDNRVLILKIGFILLFTGIVVRLIQVQVIETGRYQGAAKKQYEEQIKIPAKRGTIFDRNGNVLASNTMLASIAASPRISVSKAKETALVLARIFNKPLDYYLLRLKSVNKDGHLRSFIFLEQGVQLELAAKIDSLRLQGIFTIQVPKRLYHYGDLAASLIGMTDNNNEGLTGLESTFDEYLKGKPGWVMMQKDGKGRKRPSVDYPQVDPVDGNDLYLTLDVQLQSVVQEELKKGISDNQAEGGIAILMNPKSGEILALTSINERNEGNSEFRGARNRAATDMFEPGSLFKLITASAALEYKLVSPDKMFNAENGEYTIRFANGDIRPIRDTHKYDRMTFQEAIELSSNIVIAKISMMVGSSRFYRQARDFGFGNLTGIEIPAEAKGRLKKPQEWSAFSLCSMSFGYEVAVTPIQLAVAYSAIANNGVLLKPYIMKKVCSIDGTNLLESNSQKIRNVVSKETADELTKMFEGVVERGTGVEARVRSIRIAGKTGTARRYENGKYIENSYTSLFIGFFPATDPQYICLIMMDKPKAKGYYGGVTSGPVFKAIAERTLGKLPNPQSLQQPVVLPELQVCVTMPDVRNLRFENALEVLEESELMIEESGNGEWVLSQSPLPGEKIVKNTKVRIARGTIQNEKWVIVPNLKGMSIRRAINRLLLEKLTYSVEGSGSVFQQRPSAGEKVIAGTCVKIVCKAKAMAESAF